MPLKGPPRDCRIDRRPEFTRESLSTCGDVHELWRQDFASECKQTVIAEALDKDPLFLARTCFV